MKHLFVIFLLLLGHLSLWAADEDSQDDVVTEWSAGSGTWTDAAKWSNGVPNASSTGIIKGTSDVVIPSGGYAVGELMVGQFKGDHARVEINGGELVNRRNLLRVGDESGAEGEIDLNDGALHSFSPVLVGGAKWEPGHETKGVFRIRGGYFLARSISLGWAPGSDVTFSVEGSRATSISVLDSVLINVETLPKGNPGLVTLSFTLDEHGVTPIVIQSARGSLDFEKFGDGGRAALKIALSAVPPADDITLISAHVRPHGTFDGLPEGSEISANYGGQTYRWKLTYRGGENQCNLTLKREEPWPTTSQLTHALPVAPPPVPLWLKYPLYDLRNLPSGQPAFAGAEGFGAYTRGGKGGKTVYVDNLDDSGPGSLRAAIETDGPRTVVFRIGGMIDLKSPLIIRKPFLTIDAESAPGAGILIRYHGVEVRTHDVVLRYFRIRLGDEAGREKIGEHGLYFAGAKNCIADHLSISWTTSKILSVVKMSDLITVQWCILSEALNFRQHGFASLAGGGRVTWSHNLFAHNLSRNVRWQGLNDTDFRNNVIYDWGHTAGYGEFDLVNYVGNYLKAGPSTTQNPPYFHNGDTVAADNSLYVSDNIMVGHPDINQDNWIGIHYDRSVQADKPFNAPPVTTESAEAAYDHVLQDAGATLPKRDTVDTRVIEEVRDGKGHIINSINEVGGWEKFPSSGGSAGQ